MIPAGRTTVVSVRHHDVNRNNNFVDAKDRLIIEYGDGSSMMVAVDLFLSSEIFEDFGKTIWERGMWISCEGGGHNPSPGVKPNGRFVRFAPSYYDFMAERGGLSKAIIKERMEALRSEFKESNDIRKVVYEYCYLGSQLGKDEADDELSKLRKTFEGLDRRFFDTACMMDTSSSKFAADFYTQLVFSGKMSQSAIDSSARFMTGLFLSPYRDTPVHMMTAFLDVADQITDMDILLYAMREAAMFRLETPHTDSATSIHVRAFQYVLADIISRRNEE